MAIFFTIPIIFFIKNPQYTNYNKTLYYSKVSIILLGFYNSIRFLYFRTHNSMIRGIICYLPKLTKENGNERKYET